METDSYGPKTLSALQKKCRELMSENENLKERISELELFNTINLSLSNTLERDETFESIRQFFQTTFSLDQYSLMLRTGGRDELEVVSSFGSSFDEGQWVKIGKDDSNILFSIFEHGEPIHIPDCKKETRYNSSGFLKNKGSLVSLPLILPPDHVIGVLNLLRNRIDSFTSKEITRLAHLANHVAMVIDKSLLFHHTKLLSITDPLTGLYNRRYFDERYSREIMRAVRYKRSLSLLMIDIDFFKQYNDTLGHLMGDMALKQVAQILAQKLRRADILARYGGEEFVVLLPEIRRKNTHIVAEKLRAAIEFEKFDGQEKLPRKNVTISVGSASFPEDANSAEELIKLADNALYAAKEAGRNCVRHITQ